MHLHPLRLVILAHFMPQLGFSQPLGGGLFFFLKLVQGFFALGDELARGVGVRPQFFGDGLEPCLVIGLHPRADVLRRRVGRRVDARKPGLVLATFFQQPLDRGGALG